ncbi:hypothetical protein [Latilactobacillus sakei]|uniref:hypothetical protein n=1 Tax=Latilactobacillus sakei TaxID=1599 RepID=UPI003CF21230
MTKRKYGLIALAIGCFATISFVNHQNVQAAETVIKNKARIDTEYPLSGASNFMMVAGNQFIHNQASFSGRIMANSIILKVGANIDPPGLNGSRLSSTDTKYDNYFKNLENPAVIINDFNKSNDKILNRTNSMQNLLVSLGGMWRRDNITGDVLSKNAEFATDTTASEVIKEYSKEADKGKPSYIPSATITNLWSNKLVPNINGNLAKIPQYVDNGINKYETSEDTTEGYSLQQNIQDVSQFYANLLPEDSEFWSSTDQIMNLKQSYTDDWPNTTVREKSNPVYIADQWTDVSDIVINVVAKKDDPTVSQAVRDQTKAYTATENGKKPIIAISIDRAKVLDYNKDAKHMSLIFNFSDSFYTKKMVSQY